jgi:serine/threonine protein phosphatase 1
MDDVRRLFRPVLPRSRRAPRRYSLPDGERVYAVGDIHGCADLAMEMQSLILAHAIDGRADSITVVWLGDYIDRGPCSREVIDRLIDFARGPCRSVFLMGNHEDAMLRFLADPASGPQWCGFGGLETLASYGIGADASEPGLTYGQARSALIAALPPAHQDFFLSLGVSETIGDFFFCHAGVRPGIRVEEQDPHDLIWIREEFLGWKHDFGKMIVHGHTPGRDPELRHNRVNVDTGAFATGRLTCAVIEGSEISFLSTG